MDHNHRRLASRACDRCPTRATSCGWIAEKQLAPRPSDSSRDLTREVLCARRARLCSGSDRRPRARPSLGCRAPPPHHPARSGLVNLTPIRRVSVATCLISGSVSPVTDDGASTTRFAAAFPPAPASFPGAADHKWFEIPRSHFTNAALTWTVQTLFSFPRVAVRKDPVRRDAAVVLRKVRPIARCLAGARDA